MDESDALSRLFAKAAEEAKTPEVEDENDRTYADAVARQTFHVTYEEAKSYMDLLKALAGGAVAQLEALERQDWVGLQEARDDHKLAIKIAYLAWFTEDERDDVAKEG